VVPPTGLRMVGAETYCCTVCFLSCHAHSRLSIRKLFYYSHLMTRLEKRRMAMIRTAGGGRRGYLPLLCPADAPSLHNNSPGRFHVARAFQTIFSRAYYAPRSLNTSVMVPSIVFTSMGFAICPYFLCLTAVSDASCVVPLPSVRPPGCMSDYVSLFPALR